MSPKTPPALNRVTVEGRPATVAYFDRDGKLTTPEAAVRAKVVFDDGTRLFLTPKETQP